MRFARLLILLLLAVSPATAAQEAPDTVTTEIDWTSGTLRVTVERRVPADQATGPAAIARTQRAIRRDATEIIAAVLTQVSYDSHRTIAGLLTEREALIAAVERAAASARAIDTHATADLHAARVTFEVDLYRDLASQFVTHERPVPMERRLGWIAGTDYTGILIYAADPLPLFGTDETVQIRPALFPGLYYQSADDGLIYRLAEREHMKPRQLTTGGPVTYTSDVSAAGVADRLGSRPLRILASGAFGTRPVDVVLSEQDALAIISSPHNRALVREGRIVVVVSREQL